MIQKSLRPSHAPPAARNVGSREARTPMPDSPAPPDRGVNASDVVLEVDRLSLYYGASRALDSISLAIPRKRITAFIGPSGCGKSTLLRCCNRMNDLVDGVSILGPEVEVNELRKRIGMVFQKSNPFPKSIYDNVAYGPRVHGVTGRSTLDAIVEKSLRGAALWDEVKDRLHESALGMSGGQQQRLCIARAIAVEPEVILLDEPCSALDPVATAKVEDLMLELVKDFTLVIVTHNMQQASRVSDFTAFLYLGKMVEFGETDEIFVNPREKQTEDYITGRFG